MRLHVTLRLTEIVLSILFRANIMILTQAVYSALQILRVAGVRVSATRTVSGRRIHPVRRRPIRYRALCCRSAHGALRVFWRLIGPGSPLQALWMSDGQGRALRAGAGPARHGRQWWPADPRLHPASDPGRTAR